MVFHVIAIYGEVGLYQTHFMECVIIAAKQLQDH